MFACEAENNPCENILVVLSEGLPETQLGAKTAEPEILGLDLVALGIVGILDTAAEQQLGFATPFQVSIAGEGIEPGCNPRGKMDAVLQFVDEDQTLGMKLSLESKSKYDSEK